jgi:hypothetical protein
LAKTAALQDLPSLSLPQKDLWALPEVYTEESPLIVDNTILSTFATCSTKAMISYHHHLVSQEDSNPLLVGQAAHKALEVFFKGGGAKESLIVFQTLYYSHGSLLAPEEALSWENTQATMETWFASHAPDSLSFTALPGTIEGALTAPLWEEKWGKRVLFLGLVDLLIQERATGTLAIMDHKTTSKRLDDSWVGQFRTSAQLSGYIWLTQQTRIHEKLDKLSPVTSAYINTIQYARLPVSDRKCPRHAVPYSICKGLHALARLDGPFQRSPLQLKSWLADARALTRKWAWTREKQGELSHLREVTKEGLFLYEACKWCPFTSYCDGTISDAERLTQFFKTKEWTPWKEESPKEENQTNGH